MEIFYSLWFWLGAVAVVAIVAGVITSAITKGNETRRYVADAQNGGAYKQLAEETAELNRRLLERLDALDGRLASVERTLSEIPS